MAYQVNPLQIIQMIKGGQNPQQLMLNIMQQNMGNNPVYSNLMQLAQNNQTKDIEAFARNYAKQQGFDFDKEFNSFKRNLGL
jgi:hypothetical protein